MERDVGVKLADVVRVERREKRTGWLMVVETRRARAASGSAGEMDSVTRRVESMDPWHPDFRNAWHRLEAVMRESLGQPVFLRSLVWGEDGEVVAKAEVGVWSCAAGLAAVKVPLEPGGKVGRAVLLVDEEARAWASGQKREQRELELVVSGG